MDPGLRSRRRGAGRRPGPAALLAAALLLLPAAAPAQVELDGSLGPAGPPNFDIPTQTWQITEGLGSFSAGRTNLFHSFSVFSPTEDTTASFSAMAPFPQRVIARVTGEASQIDGAVESLIPGADLFLLNPRGIVFGPRSSLDLQGGSAWVSTATGLVFADDVVFETGVATPPAVLSAAAPAEFGFLTTSPLPIAPIVFDRTGDPMQASTAIELSAGETLAAVGGDVTLLGVNLPSDDTRVIAIEGGSIEIASVATKGISVPVDVASFDARSFAPDALGEITMMNDARLDVGTPSSGGVGDGRVVIRGGRFEMQGGLVTAIARDSGGAVGQPVSIDLELAGRTGPDGVEGVVLRDGALLQSVSALAPAGDIEISAPRVDVIDNAQIQSVGVRATGPTIWIAADDVSVDGATILATNTFTAAGGRVDLDVPGTLEVSGLAIVGSLAIPSATGAGGDVEIDAGSVRVTSEDSAAATVSQISARTEGAAPGGALLVKARDIELIDGGQLRTRTQGNGAAGPLTLRGPDGERLERLHVIGVADAGGSIAPSGVFARSFGAGDGGDLRVDARVVEIEDGGEVSTQGLGGGAAGSLVIENAELVRVAGATAGSPSSISAKGAAGGAGDLSITADTVSVVSGGNVTVSTLSTGDAGTLFIGARDVEISGFQDGNESALFAQTLSGASDSGDAGSIVVRASGEVRVDDGARIAVESFGGGLAGDVRILGADRVTIADGAEISARVRDTRAPGPGDNATSDIVVAEVGALDIDAATVTAETLGTGAGGDIAFRTTSSTVLQNGALVTARSTGSGAAGSIDVDAGRRFAAVEGSSLETLAEFASGGQIEISASKLVYFSNSQADTFVAMGGGDGGDFGIPVVLNSPEIAAAPRLAVLNRSRIVARAQDGMGGNIEIAAGEFFPSDRLVMDETLALPRDSVIDATSATGLPGEIVVTSPDAELAGQLTPLPSNYLDASSLMQTPCEARRQRAGSFVVQSRAALEPPPDAPLGPPAAYFPAGSPALDAGNCLESENQD